MERNKTIHMDYLSKVPMLIGVIIITIIIGLLKKDEPNRLKGKTD